MKEKMLLSEFIKELEENTNSSTIDQAIFTLRIMLAVNGNVQVDLESMKKYTGITIYGRYIGE
jgi:hypothetical protein